MTAIGPPRAAGWPPSVPSARIVELVDGSLLDLIAVVFAAS